MKKRPLYTTIFIIAMLGLFFVQYKYLKIGVSLASVQFKKNLEDASKNIKNGLTDVNQITFLIGQTFDKKTNNFNISRDSIKGTSNYFLKNYLAHKLELSGITTDFTYKLIAKDSSFQKLHQNTYYDNKKTIKYPIKLEGFLPNITDKDVILELQFKNVNAYLLSQLNGLTIPSLLFMIIIIIIFIWFLRSVYWQKQIITTTNSFINNLTHELKTPVFSINLAAKMLEKDLNETKKPFLEIIRQQTNRLDKHIDKVLELGNIEFNKDMFHLKKVDFKPYLIKICEDFEVLSKLNNTHFSFEIKAEKLPIKAEIIHLENAISNILDNAQKYSENPVIKLVAIVEKKQVIISVSDNGIGINKKDMHLIFKKYYRVSNGDLHKVKGYGLGLSYVKEVIKKHKAKITIDSNIGEGTTVHFYIPLIYEN